MHANATAPSISNQRSTSVPYRPWVDNGPVRPSQAQENSTCGARKQDNWRSWEASPQLEARPTAMEWTFHGGAFQEQPKKSLTSLPIPISGNERRDCIIKSKDDPFKSQSDANSAKHHDEVPMERVSSAHFSSSSRNAENFGQPAHYSAQPGQSWAPSFGTGHGACRDASAPSQLTQYPRKDGRDDFHTWYHSTVGGRENTSSYTSANHFGFAPAATSYQERKMEGALSPTQSRSDSIAMTGTPPSSSSAEIGSMPALWSSTENARHGHSTSRWVDGREYRMETGMQRTEQYTRISSPMPQPKIGFKPVPVSPKMQVSPVQHAESLPQEANGKFFSEERQRSLFGPPGSDYGHGSFQSPGGSYFSQLQQNMRTGSSHQHGPGQPGTRRLSGVQEYDAGDQSYGQMDFSPATMSSYMTMSMPADWPNNMDGSCLSTSAPNAYLAANAAETVQLRRREMHNLLERKRRSGLKDCFQILADVLPGMEGDEGTGQAPAKVKILELATRHIRELKAVGENRQETLAVQRAMYNRLCQRISQLQERQAPSDYNVEAMEL